MDDFSGSYKKEDVTFLLKQLTSAHILSVNEKEQAIADGAHYSEMLSPESAPKDSYLALFKEQVQLTKAKLAADILHLCRHAATSITHARPVAIVSLARAGTPIGVLVGRTLRSPAFGLNATHYSVSIVRDKGLDLNALGYISERYCDSNILFFDGWTGKGVIGRELTKSVNKFNEAQGKCISPHLHVVADIAGTAEVSATNDDYLIPSAILNATVSGLISRTVLNAQIGENDYHGCLYLKELAEYDQSQFFVDTVYAEIKKALQHAPVVPPAEREIYDPQKLHTMVAELQKRYDLASPNLVKPGVGESTRVMLRRKPLLLILRNTQDPEVQHLISLANTKLIRILQLPSLPCKAIALIEQPD